MLHELVVKNLYILTTNIAGLRTGGNVGELWAQHQDTARAVATDVIAVQEALTESRFDPEQLIESMVQAFEGDPQHQCMGRSAPARLQRALEHAERLGVADTDAERDRARAHATTA
jgi:exonuclease III